jgi:large repetitive protein
MTNGPIVANAIPDQISWRHAYWQFTFASNTFSDVDSPSLNYAAMLPNGDPLPYWLSFNGDTRTFAGTPPRSGSLRLDHQRACRA